MKKKIITKSELARIFEEEIEKYSFNWREGGQYSKDKFLTKNQ